MCRSRPHAYLYRPEIVGRMETIESLRECVRGDAHDDGAFVILGGVSGIGKTSVAAVIAREATLRQHPTS